MILKSEQISDMDTRVITMPKTKTTKRISPRGSRRVSSLRSKYNQTGGSLAMAWVLDERKRKSQKPRRKSRQKPQQTLTGDFKITEGHLTDVKFVGPTGLKDWMGVELEDFYVIIPEQSVVLFRRPSVAQFKLRSKDIVDHLKSCPDFRISPGAKLSYRGAEVPDNVDLASLKIAKAAYILGPADPAHSGKLFSCLNDSCVDSLNHRRGFNRLQKFQRHQPTVKTTKKQCKLQFAHLLLDPQGKRGWGGNLDYAGGNPYGCPGTQRGRKDKYSVDEAPGAAAVEGEAAAVEEVLVDISHLAERPGGKTQNREEGEDEAAAVEEGPAKRRVGPGPKTQKNHPVPSVVQSDASEANRAERRNTMKLKLLQQSDLVQFEPDDQDKEFERVYILAPSMTSRNRKFPLAQTNLIDIRPESIQAMKDGRIPAHPDHKYVSGTWKNNLAGARNLMTLWMKDLKQESIHYRQFFAFGKEDLLKPRNVLELLDNGLTSGNDKLFALTAYQMILTAQLEESRKAELSFSPLIENSKWEGLTPVQRQDKCSKLAETFRTSVSNILTEFQLAKAQSKFRNEVKQRHDLGVALKERLLGSNVLNPAEVVPMYFQDSSVCAQTAQLIAAASDGSLIPTGKQMKQFANTVLVRLMIKGCSRKEIFVKMTRMEYLEARRTGLKVVQFLPNDDPAHQTDAGADGQEVTTATVYDLGEDIGRFRMVMRPVQGNTEDPSDQGLVVERKIHKTAHKGVAYLLLGLPDMALMDSYHALAIRYCKSKGLSYNHESTFFITPQGKEVVNVDFSQFCHITGYSEFTPHQARKVFASWVASQKSQRLTECATFAANHSLAIQQSHYVSSDAKRIQALEALTYYQRTIGGEEFFPDDNSDEDDGGDSMVNLEYDQALREDLAAVEEQNWKEALERERQRDLREKVKLDRFVTQNVRFNAVSLIRSLGSDQAFVSACGADVLQFFLGQKAQCFNLQGRSLLLAMLDWDPSRPEAQVLLDNLYLVCSWLDSGTSVNAVEHDWAAKVVRSVYKLSSELYVSHLPLRLKDLLLELNEVSDWKYCCGNPKVEHMLRALKTSKARASFSSGGGGLRPGGAGAGPGAGGAGAAKTKKADPGAGPGAGDAGAAKTKKTKKSKKDSDLKSKKDSAEVTVKRSKHGGKSPRKYAKKE